MTSLEQADNYVWCFNGRTLKDLKWIY